MPYNVELDRELGLVKVIYTGMVTADDVYQASVKSLELLPANFPFKFLSFFDNADIKLSASDLKNLFQVWRENNSNKNSKLALVCLEKNATFKELFEYEVIASLVNWRVKLFSQINEAIKWLNYNNEIEL